MKVFHWIVPLIVLICCVGCTGSKTEYEGKWVDTYSDTTLEISRNKLVIEYGGWKDTYKFKVKKEYGITYLSNVNGDGSFDMMTELKVCEDGSLQAYMMLLDADTSPYRFVREEDKEKEQAVQDLSENLPKEIQSKELNYFCLSFDYDVSYGLNELWPSGDYHWTIEKMDDGNFDMCFQVYQDSYMAINYHETVTEEYVSALAILLEECGVIDNNGYCMKNNKSTKEYLLVANYESGEYVSISAQGEPAKECVFDLQTLLNYAAKMNLFYEE